MPLNWIKPEDYSFNSLLLLERFQIKMLFDSSGWRFKDEANAEKWPLDMGVALNANPAVKWYLIRRCPESRNIIEDLALKASSADNKTDIRQAEVSVLLSMEDFIIYTTPELMETQCDFIRGWSKERLFSMAGLAGKTVLDIGAGSGRLAFAAAEKAAWVYASEPVGSLREYMRDKIAAEGIRNIRVSDGLVTELPFPDDTFDVVMSGHVVGDFWDEEVAEMTRVCKHGGWILTCPGDSEGDIKPSPELTERGFEEIHYTGSYGFDVYQYCKRVIK